MVQQVRFEGSYPQLAKIPEVDQPAYAFVGRSNVGKSSLINTLVGRKAAARVSKQPGKTQLINVFRVNEQWQLIDLPGYGYAKESKKKRYQWERMVRSYLKGARNLQTTFLLVDANIPPQELDVTFLNWLGQEQIPCSLVYTKVDRLKRNQRQANLLRIKRKFLESWESLPPEFAASSVTGEGRELILQYIAKLNDRYRSAPR